MVYHTNQLRSQISPWLLVVSETVLSRNRPQVKTVSCWHDPNPSWWINDGYIVFIQNSEMIVSVYHQILISVAKKVAYVPLISMDIPSFFHDYNGYHVDIRRPDAARTPSSSRVFFRCRCLCRDCSTDFFLEKDVDHLQYFSIKGCDSVIMKKCGLFFCILIHDDWFTSQFFLGPDSRWFTSQFFLVPDSRWFTSQFFLVQIHNDSHHRFVWSRFTSSWPEMGCEIGGSDLSDVRWETYIVVSLAKVGGHPQKVDGPTQSCLPFSRVIFLAAGQDWQMTPLSPNPCWCSHMLERLLERLGCNQYIYIYIQDNLVT